MNEFTRNEVCIINFLIKLMIRNMPTLFYALFQGGNRIHIHPRKQYLVFVDYSDKPEVLLPHLVFVTITR